MENIKEIDKLIIPAYAKIKVYWDDKPENYSREGRNRVKSIFARKYGVNKNNINVVFRPIKIDKNGNVIEISGAGIDNIMDVNYQRNLFKEWLLREEKDVDFERIVKLDEKVNASLDMDLTEITHRKWELKWLTINNFLSYGQNNYADFGKLRGLSIINSIPKNQGGKTTFSVDAIKFLLFGKTTKTDTNAEIFNTFTDDNTVTLRGMINYDDKDIIIERILTRNGKRAGGYTVKNKLSYYKLMPDGEEILLEEEDAISTTAEIKKTIGDESDFDITILTTAKNLEDLIDTTPTESGKLLTKFIGIEVIEKKENIVRKMHTEFSKTMKSNHYDVKTLTDDIDGYENSEDGSWVDGHKNMIVKENELLNNQNNLLEAKKIEINELNIKKDNLLTSKKLIDVVITQLNPKKLESEIETITQNGVKYKDSITEYKKELTKLGSVNYDEVKYFNLGKEYNISDVKKLNIENDIIKSEKLIDQLKNGEICPTCKRALDNVDHSNEIKIEEEKLLKLKNDLNIEQTNLIRINKIRENMDKDKKDVDRRNQLELLKIKAEVEITSLRTQLKDKKTDLEKYNDNQETIDYNRLIDAQIEDIKTNIIVKENEKDKIIRDIQMIELRIKTHEENILSKTNIIESIYKENEVDRLFKIYIEMIGKKGISKLILRSVLPIINSELYRLMEDVCDFTIELNINSKNDVEFILNKSGVDKKLKSGSGFEKTASSIALRCVLGKMSHLPMPNFITFDEPFGMVADDNLERMKPMFDKIKDMYDIVFLISHIDTVKDWGDNIITVKKINDISEILVK